MTTSPDGERRKAPPAPAARRGGLGWLWLLLAVVILGCVVVFVLHVRGGQQAQVAANTAAMATPTVLVVTPQKGDPTVHLVLPGTVYSLIESSVYAQVGGYIKAWHYDIGAKVKAGDLLAEIDTPVTDQQLRQAQENVKQAEANLNLAKITSARYNDLLQRNAVAQQDADNQNAQEKVQEANLSAAQAFEQGIERTEDFKQVRAPFDGVITSRRVDVGDFVTATGQTQTQSNNSLPVSTGTPIQALFRIAQTKVLRIYVNVPEQYADQAKPGTKAQVVMASAPTAAVTGTLVRTADSIDPNSLTLLTEVDVDNSDGRLLPGGYAQVHLDLVTGHPPLVVPGNTLIFRQAGPQVGVVGSDGVVHLKKITIGRDLGTKLEITSGIESDDQIVLNPSDSLADGQKVNINSDPSNKAP